MCLEDVPGKAKFDINVTALVGIDFNANKQCQALYGPTAAFCPYDYASEVNYWYPIAKC